MEETTKLLHIQQHPLYRSPKGRPCSKFEPRFPCEAAWKRCLFRFFQSIQLRLKLIFIYCQAFIWLDPCQLLRHVLLHMTVSNALSPFFLERRLNPKWIG